MEFASIGDLAALFNRNKSAINHYYTLGFITPIGTAGKTLIFDKKETIIIIKKIEKFKEKGKSLEEIKELLKS